MTIPKNKTLPKLLNEYRNSDFETQLKAKFIYYLSISIVFVIIIVTVYSLYIQSLENEINFEIILIEIALVFSFTLSLYILVKGHYLISANIILTTSFIAIWLVIFFDRGNEIIRLDSIVFILAMLATIPLFSHKKSIIFFYFLANLIIFTIFIINTYSSLDAKILDYIADSVSAMIIITIIGHNIFRINRLSLERATSVINEKIQAEESLKKSEERFRSLIELSSIPILIMKEETFLYYNAALKKILILGDEEIIGKSVLDYIVPEERGRIADYIKKRIKNEPVPSHYESIGIRKNKEIFEFEININIVNLLEGPVSLAFIQDISDRKRAEQALKESEEKFRNLVELSPYPIVLTDRDNNILMINESFCKEFNYLQEEIIGKNIFSIGFVFKNNYIEIVKETELGKNVLDSFEVQIENRNGENYFCLYSSKIFTLNSETVILSSIVNITEMKKMGLELERHKNFLEMLVKERTIELEKTNRELNEKNNELKKQGEQLRDIINKLSDTQKHLIQSEKMASLGILSAGIAHEINNPLNFIKGGILAIENYFDDNLKDQKENVEPLIYSINEGVRRATKIVSSLNHYSRRDDSKEIDCDLQQIIDNCLTMLNNQIKNKISITKNYSKVDCIIKGNEGKLHQAFLNILSNAEQAISTEGVIQITTSCENSIIFVSIKDSGCGIKKEKLNRIFDPFFTTKEPGKGTGLGLAITYNIVKEHNGTIEINSEENNGSEVILRFNKC